MTELHVAMKTDPRTPSIHVSSSLNSDFAWSFKLSDKNWF